MEDLKIGLFIRDRRTELGLTQQQLAGRLGITDKAVSKWERSVSYPDITILRELSAALDVSVTELLAGERDPQLPETVPPEVQEVVLDTVSYAETARKRNSGWRFWTFVAVSAGCAIAALVLGILYLNCHGSGTHQAIKRAIQSVAFGWAVCYPLLRTDDHPIRNMLFIVSVSIYPFILALGAQEARHFGIVIVSVAYAWSVYWTACRYREEKTKAIALLMALGLLLHVCICLIAGVWGTSDMLLGVPLFLAAGAMCMFGMRVLDFFQVRARQ